MAESKETVLGIIQNINNATEPGSVTNRMVAVVLNYLAESLLTGETIEELNNLKNRMSTAEGRLDNLGITDIRNAIAQLQADLQSESSSRSSSDSTITDKITALENSLNTLLEGDVTSAIESFQEVLNFLSGITDDELLVRKLSDINDSLQGLSSRIAALEASGSVDTQKIANGAVTGAKIASSSIEMHHLSPNLQKVLADAKDVIMVDFWTDETTAMMKDSIDREGQYLYQTEEKRLYVSAMNDELQFVFTGANLSDSTIYIDRENGRPYIWKDDAMVAIAPAPAPASIFNATTEVPISGFYVLVDDDNKKISAVHAAWEKEKAVSGLIISFEISAGIWKTYQYIGKTVTESNWIKAENWKDFGSLAAGSEPYIIIDSLIGRPTVGQYYTLATAVQALLAYQGTTKVTYAKKGLIISYGTGENVMETKQFQGEVTDFGEVGLWKDFGGGGSDVETSDTPESGGKKALSTGGAYAHIPVTAIQVESEDDTKIAFRLANADGEPVGEPFFLPKGGGGSASNKIFSINFQKSPFYAAAGGQFIIKASIRSVVTEGSSETSEAIERIDIIDRDSAQTLYTNTNVNKASSASAQDYSFSFDLSGFFSSPASRRLQMIAYDTAGERTTRTLNVVAVDVTVESTQVLNYNASSVVFTTDSVKSLPMYKFPNNQGAEGINAKVEIFISGEWKTLGTADIRDTYSHNITVNPADAAGEVLTHGAYPIRIQGTDNASGVKGNTIYSTLMVINPDSDVPVVALRYNDTGNGSVRLYDSIQMEVAAYNRQSNETNVQLKENSRDIASFIVARNKKETATVQINNVTDGTQLIYKAVSGSAESGAITVTVNGSAIDAAMTEGAAFSFDFANRTNSESGDHAIESNDFRITVNGANYSSNGFQNFLGANALAIKENVTAEMNHAPFSTSGIENSGYALLFQFATENVIDNDAHLMECYDPLSGAGFYVTGGEVVICCKNGNRPVVKRSYPQGEKITVGIVVEPGSKYVEKDGTRYSLMKLFLNGEEAGCLGYVPAGSNLIQANNIRFDGTKGALYLYYMIGWMQAIEWMQEFYNYLVKLVDTQVMIEEFQFEDVWEGNTVNGPSLNKLASRGMPYLIEQPFNGSNIAALDNTTSTKDSIFITLVYRDPQRPWRDFIAYNVRRRNQGTTSAKRPIKNARYNLGKKSKNDANTTYVVDGITYGNVCLIKPLHTREEIMEMGYDGALWDEASKLMANNKIRVGENTIPVDVITVKVDFSDSTNANDCGACNMMNATYRALGPQFMTPAQRFYDGTYSIGSGDNAVNLTGLLLNHSTANHPIAMFRDPDGTGANMYFYAKGNWKEDKGEQVALGFKDTPGYNKGCLNYQDGDFIEYFGTRDETLDQIEARFKQSQDLDTAKVYLLSLYCGSSYRFMRYSNGQWVNTTGTMKMVAGKWTITGDVLNPVDGYELLAYTGMDWFMGVSSIDDMMAPVSDSAAWVQKLVASGDVSATTFPAWTQYFECMIDNDQLQIDLAMGRKVPYNLYAFLRFCNSCDYSKVEDYKNIWRDNLRYFANPRSLFTYNGFTDYLAAVDQQAKNMQPMFFLDEGQSVENGVYKCSWKNVTFSGYEPALIMYPNKIYDADGLNGKENEGDAGVDPEVDPNKPSDENTGYSNPYAGWGSVLWNNIYRQPTVIDAAGAEISMQTVAAAMRATQATVNGKTLAPFSPEGAMHFFMEEICHRWQKTVSSFDGERKFIQHTPTADAVYFYALHGLRLTSIPSFIQKRFRIRDGFYKTGLFFTSVFTARINAGADAVITIKAAKTGYFGLGIDSSGDLKESVYLEAGQSHSFTKFQRTDGTSIEGALLYIYQCDRIAEIDFNEVSLSDTANFSVFTLAEKIVVGDTGHKTMPIGAYAALSTLDMGSMPFLKELVLRDTVITHVDASKCPRLEKLLASGSRLQSVAFAETSPVSVVELPATVTELKMVNLPVLTYNGNDGLTFEGMANINRLHIDGCPALDGKKLLTDAISAGASITRIRLARIDMEGSSSILSSLMENRVIGLDADGVAYDESGQCSGLTGTWTMTNLIEDDELAALQQYFPLLDIYNVQYTMIEIDDTDEYDGNIKNLENGTKDGIGNGYQPSGHITRLQSMLHVYKGTYLGQGRMKLEQISDRNMYELANGEAYDPTDAAGEGYDNFLGVPHYWYKGINDHLAQKKYYILSTLQQMPRSTAKNTNRSVISKILLQGLAAVRMGDFSVGDKFTKEKLFSSTTSNVYRHDVRGMKQVRFPSVSSSTTGCLFLDENDLVIKVQKTEVTHAQNDYIDGEYLFLPVPEGAASFIFTAARDIDDVECIATDSDKLEAIEPDWVEHNFELCAVEKGSVDRLVRFRGISGATPKVGTGTSTTSGHWEYDENGDLTVGAPSSVTALNYTCKDLLNLARCRGEGYFAIDYEMAKDISNIWIAIHGRRNSQAVNGVGVDYNVIGKTTGATLNAQYPSPFRETTSGRVRTMGLEDWWAHIAEWMDGVAVNVPSWKAFYKNHCIAPSGSPVNGIWHICMPDGTERSVRGVDSDLRNGAEIARMRWGRYCDLIPSRVVTNNNFNTFYCDGFWLQRLTGRCVLRSGHYSSPNGGIAYVGAGNDAANSSTGGGSRLAFRGEIEFVE